MSGIPDLPSFRASLPPTEGVPNLGPGEARALCEEGAVLLDLREAYETNYRVFAVPRVIYIPWSRFPERLEELPREEALILADAAGIYCREAARLLLESGRRNLAKLSGGMIDWDAAGLPLRKDEEYALGGQCACKIKTRHGGNPLIAKDAAGDNRGVDMTKVLFLCVHNSARSQMAEAFLKQQGGGRFEAESAGLEPGRLNPFVVRAMAERGIDISGNPTKSVFELRAAGKTYDLVVTVCSKEAAERCPVFPGRVERLHWPFEDPSSFTGSEEEIMERVRSVRDQIESAVRELVEGRPA